MFKNIIHVRANGCLPIEMLLLYLISEATQNISATTYKYVGYNIVLSSKSRDLSIVVYYFTFCGHFMNNQVLHLFFFHFSSGKIWKFLEIPKEERAQFNHSPQIKY